MQVANDDYSLWQAFKNGDKDAFQTLYFSSFKNLYEYGMRIVRDPELVKDCIHDLFVKLWSRKSTLADVNAIKPYLLVSLRTTLYNKLEKSSRMTTADIDEHQPFQMAFSVEADFINKETKWVQTQKLMEALNGLTPRQKEVIYLRYFEEMEYEEVAAVMNITVKATYKLTARGVEALRQVLNVSNAYLLLLMALMRVENFS